MASLLTGSVLVQHKGSILNTSREIPLTVINSMTTKLELAEGDDDGYLVVSLEAKSKDSVLKFKVGDYKRDQWTDSLGCAEVVRLYHSALHNFFCLTQIGLSTQVRESVLQKVNEQIKSSGYVVKKN